MPENLYQQNTNILKEFFKKPIVLITSIVWFATIIVNFFLGIFMSNNDAIKRMIHDILTMEGSYAYTYTNTGLNIPIVSVLIALAFLLFYISSRKADGGLNGAATLFKVVSIIALVASCILSAVCVLAMFLCFVLMLIPAAQFIFIFILFFAVLVAMLLIESISQLFFANAIKKSLNGIYLYKNGAMTFAVIQFIKVSVFALLSIICYFVYIGISSQPGYYYPLVPELFLLAIISFVVSIPSSLFMGILALKYSSYISTMSQGYVPTAQPYTPQQSSFNPQPNPYNPQQNSYTPQPNPYNQQQGAYNNPQPNQFNPQPNPYESQPEPAGAEADVSAAEQSSQPAEQNASQTYCSICGKPLSPDDYFCNRCGTPVKR